MSVEAIVLLASLPIPVLASLFWHARVYSLYRLLSDDVGNVSYYWFSFQLQSPQFAKQLPGYVDFLNSLPAELATKVSVVRRQMKYATLAIACWMLLVLTLIGLSFGR